MNIEEDVKMVIIRRAYPTDAYSIVGVNLEVWKCEYNDILPSNIIYDMYHNIDNMVKHLKDQIEENNRIFVAVDEDKIVGFVFYAKSKSEEYSSAAEIRSIYVLEDYQGKGLGSQLLDKAMEEIKKLGFKSLVLDCPVKNKNNDFFIKRGGEFKEIISLEVGNYFVDCNVIYFDLRNNHSNDNLRWQTLYTKLVDVSLSIAVNRGNLALVESGGEIYLGLDVFEMVSALEVAISNMKMASKDKIDRILIMGANNELIIPNERDLEALVNCGNKDAKVLIDVMTMDIKKVGELVK